MVKLNVKKYQYLLGVIVLLAGIALYAFFSNFIQYVGIGLITMAYAYFVYLVYLKIAGHEDNPFRSRIRDQMMKYQIRK